MTKDQVRSTEEALKLALSCLQKNHYYMIDAGLPNQSMLNEGFAAITAIKQALAAPVQEPVAWYDREMDSAYTEYEIGTGDTDGLEPLYTAPPAQPAPVQEPSAYGVLFAVEQAAKNGDCPWEIETAFDAYEAERKAKLKEKNT